MKSRALTFLLSFLVLAAVSLSAEARGFAHPLDATAVLLAEDLNVARIASGLQPVLVDSVASYFTGICLDDSLDSLGLGFFDRPDIGELLGRHVADWEKRCFFATAESSAALPPALQATPGYLQAVLDSLTSHVVVGAGHSPDGLAWASACLVHRLVELGPSKGMISSTGPSSVTVQGTTDYPEVMLQAHRTDEDAPGDESESPSVVVFSDDSGAFSATLWFPARGPANYDVVVLVRRGPDDEFRPAAKVRHFAPKPVEMEGPAKVTPIGTD